MNLHCRRLRVVSKVCEIGTSHVPQLTSLTLQLSYICTGRWSLYIGRHYTKTQRYSTKFYLQFCGVRSIKSHSIQVFVNLPGLRASDLHRGRNREPSREFSNCCQPHWLSIQFCIAWGHCFSWLCPDLWYAWTETTAWSSPVAPHLSLINYDSTYRISVLSQAIEVWSEL
jgi:hypothetical protein